MNSVNGEAATGDAAAGAAPYLVVALNREPPAELAAYVAQLVADGLPVWLVLADDRSMQAFWQLGEAEACPLLAVHALRPVEKHPLLVRLIPWRKLRKGAIAAIRPWLLGRRWRSVANRFDVAAAGRLVAADVYATTLVWRLCRRYPHIPATAALERPAATSRRTP